MNDTDKLNLLADWFDAEQDKGRWGNEREVQEDLRDLARRILAIGGNIPQQDAWANRVGVATIRRMVDWADNHLKNLRSLHRRPRDSSAKHWEA